MPLAPLAVLSAKLGGGMSGAHTLIVIGLATSEDGVLLLFRFGRP